MEKILFAGSSDAKTAKKFSQITKVRLGKILIKKFACGEKYIQLLDEVKEKKAYIYQAFNKTPDEALMEALLIAQATKEAKAKKIILISPLLLYSRQNKKTKPEKKEPVSAKLLAQLYKCAGIDEILTCHLHSKDIVKFYSELNIKIINVETHHLFAKALKKIISKKNSWQVIAPDKGSRFDAEKLAQLMGGLKVGYFEKKREDPTKKLNKVAFLEFSGKNVSNNVILFDDMVDTGETILKVKKKVEKLGAKRVILTATHPILSGRAKEKLEKAKFFKIFFSNSIPLKGEIKNLKIVDLLSKIKKYL
ncbi:MAG: Ribose-phosphate pyrophosphokinase [Syntrophomonadaceae bacterium]|nr:Ribose-phosphate pyrophosphokinase [Bacillota bacterium]